MDIENLVFTPFVPNASFLYHLKTSGNLKVFWWFQWIEKVCIGNKWITLKIVLGPVVHFYIIPKFFITHFFSITLTGVSLDIKYFSKLWLFQCNLIKFYECKRKRTIKSRFPVTIIRFGSSFHFDDTLAMSWRMKDKLRN